MSLENGLYPKYAAVCQIVNWGGDEFSLFNGSLVEIVDKRHAFVEVRPVNPIEGWGSDLIVCRHAELKALNNYTTALLEAFQELFD